MPGIRNRLLVGGPIVALVLALLGWAASRALDPERRALRVEGVGAAASEHGAASSTTVGRDAASGGPTGIGAAAPALPDAVFTDEDVAIFRERMAWARAERLDTLPLGEIVARLGRTFVGTPYVAHTLEVDGPERLVINLRGLDCVTFVESTLAMARLIRAGSDDFEDFKRELARIRYRGGVIDGYTSRLHYFSDWIADGERKGLVFELADVLDAVPDPEPVDFMSSNPDAYRQLADPSNLAAIRRVEAGLSSRPRRYVPQDRIAAVEDRIRNGDIIAATSTVRGLDVAHTGIAIWIDGRLHLLHAPLVGKTVEISEVPLAERIQGLKGQDGIMVARPS